MLSNSDSEMEEDEEEILVYVEFDNCATNDVFSNENLKLDMLGLDSEHPVMQVNGKFFQGTYEDAVGTYLFFEKDNNPIIDDSVFDKVPTLKYFNQTRKLLRMQRAFVIPRYEVVGDSEHIKSIPNIETIREAGVPPNYQEEALSFWKESRDKRMDALHEYLRKQEFRKELRLRGFEPESESDEDNPFAMYKYLENKSGEKKNAEKNDNNIVSNPQTENLENPSQTTELDEEENTLLKKLTIIDPGPSTSKQSIPWIDDNNVVSLQKQSVCQKVKSVGKIREKSTKSKVQKKAQKKKKIPLTQNSSSGNSKKTLNEFIDVSNNDTGSNQLQDNRLSEIKLINSDNSHENNKVVNPQNSTTEEIEVNEIAIEESGRLLSKELKLNESFIMDKKRRKQEKREAKMKEISEKLKKYNQCSSQTNN